MANPVRTWSTAALFWKVIVTLFELNVLVVTPIVSGVGVGVNVAVAVAVGVGVNVAVAVAVAVGVNVAFSETLAAGVTVGVGVGTSQSAKEAPSNVPPGMLSKKEVT
jgi:hypothetical protein